MPKSLGLKPVPVFDDEDLQLTAKPRRAQATINENFQLIGTRIKRLEADDEQNQRPIVLTSALIGSGAISSSAPPTSNYLGSTLAFDTVNANAFAIVFGHWDFTTVVTGYGTAIGGLWVTGGSYGAGTDISNPQAIFQVATVGVRLSVGNTWHIALPGPASYTIAMYGRRSIAAGQVTGEAFHSNLKVLIFDEQ